MDFMMILKIVRVLSGIAISLGASVVALPSFVKPEDFFIKRLRPDPDLEITHARLLAMAFCGGLLTISAALLGGALVYGEISPYSLKLWLVVTLVVGTSLGAAIYIYYRLWRYRELAPEERGFSGSQRRSVFIRRETPNRKTELLRIGLIIMILPATWAAAISSLLIADLILIP